jgi:hypothetical protein
MLLTGRSWTEPRSNRLENAPGRSVLSGNVCWLGDDMGSMFSATPRRWLCRAAFGVLACAAAAPAAAATFNVNSPADVHDWVLGDGHCETGAGNGICTVRAAFEEANALSGTDTITLQANATYPLVLATKASGAVSELVISDSVTVIGSNSTLDAGSNNRVLGIYRCIRGETNASDSSCIIGAVTVALNGITFQHGSSTLSGGGISTSGIVTMTHCVITENTLSSADMYGGGGIFNSGTLTLVDSVVSHNSVSGTSADGAGIYNYTSVTILDSEIRDNESTAGSGGGLYNTTPYAVVRNSTFTGNHALFGGGIGGVGLSVSNSTISGNFSDGNGGGIGTGGTIKLYNTTVTNNLANADDTGSAHGGGISGNFILSNSIVQGNLLSIASGQFATLVNDECNGMITSSPPNLLSVDIDPAHCTVTGGYATGAANFAALGGNGGPTRTHALLAGSAAIDTGNEAGCTDDLGAPLTRDQRGVPRPYGARCDLGAFEAAEVIFRDGFNGP